MTPPLWSLFQSFRHLWWRIFFLFTLDATSAVVIMIPPLFAILIFDYALPEENLRILFLALGGGLLTYLISFAITSWGDYLNTKIDQEMNATLASNLFERVERAQLAPYQKLKTGDVMVRMTHDTDIVTGLLVNLPSNALVSILQLAVFFLLAYFLDPRATLLGLIAVPLYAWQTRVYSRRLEARTQAIKGEESNLAESLREKLANIRLIKTLCQQGYEKERLHHLLQRRADATLKHRLTSISHAFSQSTILQFWTIVVTAYLGFEVIRGHLSIGEMIALGIYLPLIQQPVSQLSRLWVQKRTGDVSLRRLGELQRLPQEREKRSSVVETKGDFSGDIELQGLSFSYNGGPNILEDLNIVIPENRLTAVVGPSGIGKSTLVSLFMNLYQPTVGAISVGGQILHDADAESLRQHIGVVFQEIGLFSESIRENITYGMPQATDEEIREAARAAQADRFIEQLPQKYETLLMPWGQNLSMGQRKRIALARALLRKPKILILDEMTSALDAESEFLVQETLERLRDEMTIVVFTHQLTTTKKADVILYLDEGRILEQGSFEELMKQKGAFFDLYHLQMGDFHEFRRRLDIELERHIRYQEPVSLVLLKPTLIEQWKAHPSEKVAMAMEEVIRVIRRNLRVIDFAAIYSGHRIAITLPETRTGGAKQFLGRLLQRLDGERYVVGDITFSSPFEAGIATCDADETLYSEQLFQRAELSSSLP